jgi:hypothetical protein
MSLQTESNSLFWGQLAEEIKNPFGRTPCSPTARLDRVEFACHFAELEVSAYAIWKAHTSRPLIFHCCITRVESVLLFFAIS